MRIAAAEAERKRRRPELYCPHRRCLWLTGGGYCPRHQKEHLMDEKDVALGNVIDARNHMRRVTARAHEEYREALEAYLAVGGTYLELSKLLGVSRQAVRQYVERGRAAEMRRHLDNGGKWEERRRS